MFLNLMVLFICVNFAIGMVTGVEGSPLQVELDDDECSPYRIMAEDVNDIDGDGDTSELIRVAPDVDPITQSPFGGMSDMGDVTDEMQNPTNSTSTDPSFGAGEVFNPLIDAASRGWKGMEVMANIVSGGYIMDIIQHTSFSCQLDKKSFLTGSIVNGVVTDNVTNGNGHNCSEQTIANGYNDEKYFGSLYANEHTTVPCENATYGKWIDPMAGGNPMFDTFKGGIQVIFGLLLFITLFYWLTGRGHMLSS